jgi:hypothetical protein
LFAPAGFSNYRWFLNSNIIASSISNQYAISTSGNYSVLVTDSNGCSVQSTYLDVILGMEERFNENGIKAVYQQGELRIEFPYGREHGVVTIYDDRGAVVHIAHKEAATQSLQIQKVFSPGLYILTYWSDRKLFSRKLLIGP